MEANPTPCPCCGYLTLPADAAFEICPVCFWENDGQDDETAHRFRGGPNRQTLWEGRTNFLRIGACDEDGRLHVRPPAPDEPQVRRWSLLDDVAVELVAGTDPTPWNLLHDGSVTAVGRAEDRAWVIVEVPYLRARFEEPGEGFRLDLLGCTELSYTPYDGETITSPEAIARAEPDLVEARYEDERMKVWGSAGLLQLRYRDLALRFDRGAPLALAALRECVRLYWEAWRRGYEA